MIVYIAIDGLAGGLEGAALEEASHRWTTLAFVVFTVPLVLFSLPASAMADRLSKRTIIVALKIVELILMSLGAIALFVAPESSVLPLVILGLMGMQSALFSPAKYGIIPELVPHTGISRANAALEMWTFLAIILGTAAGGLLLAGSGGQPGFGGLALVVLAGFGLMAARRVPAVPPAAADDDFKTTLSESWKAMRGDRTLWLAVLGSTFFWCLLSLMGQDLLVYAKTVLDLDDTIVGLPAAVFGIGIGAGAWLAGRLSHDKIETGLIPLGALGLSAVAVIFGLSAPGFAGTSIMMAALGLCSGLIIVPLDSILQWRSPKNRRGGVIAVSNIFVFGGMLAGSLLAGAVRSHGRDSQASSKS